ncbi:MAG: hypothetical protein ACXVZU_05825, partial [Methanobacteriaceae archaeon]
TDPGSFQAFSPYDFGGQRGINWGSSIDASRGTANFCTDDLMRFGNAKDPCAKMSKAQKC